jgi:hypothetical protein
MKRGAANFLEKPLEENRVLVTLQSILREDRLQTENRQLKQRLSERWQLVGESPAMRRLAGQVAQLADSDASVLITGENGTGTEVVARNIHFASPRASAPFVTVNCAAIPDELIESELFGHEKGASPAAVRAPDRPLRVGRRRDALPRRGRGHAAAAQARCCARSRRTRSRASARAGDPGRHPRDRGDERGPRAAVEEKGSGSTSSTG